MAKRQTKRKVVIHLKGRDPNDPLRLFLAVEEAFRPGSIEINVGPSEGEHDPPALPDEQLETVAREHAAEVLDEKERVAKTALKGRKAKPVATGKRSLRAWLLARVDGGWRIVVKVLPVAEQTLKLAKVLKDLMG